MKLFAGTASQNLAKKVGEKLKVELSTSEVTRFSNSEVRVRVQEDVKNKTCVVIQSTGNPTDNNLMEMFFFCDALRRSEAHKVIGVIPYFGYARQDVQHRPGECVSVNVIIRFLEAIGFAKIYVLDLHDEATQGVFSIPFKNLSALEKLATVAKDGLGGDAATSEKVGIVTPDQGGIERARKFGTHFFGNENFQVSVVEKKRNQDIKHQSRALDMYGDISGKTAILVDDIATSGRTLINAAQLCRDQGATDVIACIAHNELTRESAAAIDSSSISRFYTTDTIESPREYTSDKIVTVSVDELLASALSFLVK